MIYEGKEVVLKDGTPATLKSPQREEAEALLNFIKTCYSETDFLITSADEFDMTVEQEAEFLEKFSTSDYDLMITCYIDGEIIATCSISFKKKQKTKHRATLGITVLQKYWNRGIGTLLMEELIRVAKERNILQIELEYIEGNERAKHLYEKMGFVQVAVHPNFIRQPDGTILNEYLMIKNLLD